MAQNRFTLEELMAKGGKPIRGVGTEIPLTAPEPETKPFTFGERFRASFGSPAEIEELKRRETEAGLRGRFDIGDIADIAGSLLPIAGGVAGGFLGLGGAAAGVGLGSLAKQAVGRAFGTEEDISVVEAGKEAAITYLGGKVLTKAGAYLANRIPKLLGTLTGQNVDEVASVLANPRAADIGIKQGDDALRAIVTEGAKQSRIIRGNFLQGQKEGIAKISVKFSRQ